MQIIIYFSEKKQVKTAPNTNLILCKLSLKNTTVKISFIIYLFIKICQLRCTHESIKCYFEIFYFAKFQNIRQVIASFSKRKMAAIQI